MIELSPDVYYPLDKIMSRGHAEDVPKRIKYLGLALIDVILLSARESPRFKINSCRPQTGAQNGKFVCTIQSIYHVTRFCNIQILTFEFCLAQRKVKFCLLV